MLYSLHECYLGKQHIQLLFLINAHCKLGWVKDHPGDISLRESVRMFAEKFNSGWEY